MLHDYHDLISLFNGLFAQEYDTILVAGEQEPVYLPRTEGESYHRIVFANGFFQSAMHEISHWCIAGNERRCQVDYGYWYEPDGRSEAQQKLFERVEVKPQALEWLFCLAAGSRFYVSVDNLNASAPCDSTDFKRNIVKQARRYATDGVNQRSDKWIRALNKFYKTSYPEAASFNLESIQ